MNAEQLHEIATDFRNIISESQIIGLLEQLETALQNLVNQPQQANHQTKVQSARKIVMSALTLSDFNNWGANRFQIAVEIGANQLFGMALAERIDSSFQQNAATPEVIRQDIAKFLDELRSFDQALTELMQSFDKFGIGVEQLRPGEGEIGIVIPRLATAGLYDFSKDLRRIDHEIKTLAQVVTGSPEIVKIRTISSSDFVVFLAALPDIVNFFSSIVTSLRFGYEKLQELTEILERLRSIGNSSPESIRNLEGDVETAMEKEVANVLAEIRPMYEVAVKNGLAQEGFEVTLESTIKGISSRIDRGYSYSFRIGSPAIENEDEPTVDESKQLELAENVASNNKRLQQAKMIEPGQQVLPLTWQTPDPNQDSNEGTADQQPSN